MVVAEVAGSDRDSFVRVAMLEHLDWRFGVVAPVSETAITERMRS